ncbi:MAG: NAD-dependent epimerase/dehydratase family protein [Candidatus Aureabacteria bacterium]|nr:NAD-dependent epimerase/dehydratase family protein [Candidatus Auribacterota bacterium]
MRVLITGAAGYVGSNVLAGLAADPKVDKVIGIDNFCSADRKSFLKYLKSLQKNRKVIFRELDFYDLENLIPLLEQSDVIVHLAEEKEKEIYSEKITINNTKIIQWQKNVEGYRRLLESSIICGIKKVILASWAGVYVRSEKEKMAENEPLVPINQYYHQKLSQEFYNKIFSKEYFLDTATLRMSNVYGIGSNPYRWCIHKEPDVISVMVSDAVAKNRIVVHNRGIQKRNFLYVGNAVDAVVKSVFFQGRFNGDTLNICSDEETSIIDVAKCIAGLTGAEIVHKDVSWQKNIIQHDILNLKAKKKIKFKPAGNMRACIKAMVNAIRKKESRS